MLAKLALLFHNKVALAVLGTLLLGGGGTAVVAAAAANGTTIPLLHQSTAASDAQHEAEAELHGTVGTVGNGFFTVKLADGTSKTVTVSDQTQFKDELKGLGDLKAGMQVEVKGDAQADGTFAATSIEVVAEANANENEQENENAAELEGVISSIGTSSFVLKLEDGATKTVTVSNQTEFEDGLHGLGDLKAGMQVEVKGSPQADGTFAAMKVEVQDEGHEGQSGSGDDTSQSGRSGGHGDDGSGGHGGSGGDDTSGGH